MDGPIHRYQSNKIAQLNRKRYRLKLILDTSRPGQKKTRLHYCKAYQIELEIKIVQSFWHFQEAELHFYIMYFIHVAFVGKKAVCFESSKT